MLFPTAQCSICALTLFLKCLKTCLAGVMFLTFFLSLSFHFLFYLPPLSFSLPFFSTNPIPNSPKPSDAFVRPLFHCGDLKNAQTPSGEDLERNDGSTDKPYFMSKELHEILSKIKPDEPDEASPPAQVQADEETPLQQEDGEIQVKQETVLRTENEEEQQPLNQEPPCQAAAEESEPPQDKTPPPQTPQEPETQTAEPQTTPLLNGYLDVEPEEKNEPEVTPQPGAVAAEEDEQDEEEKPKENGPLEIDTPLTPQD